LSDAAGEVTAFNKDPEELDEELQRPDAADVIRN
jgi:hypothetical protein